MYKKKQVIRYLTKDIERSLEVTHYPLRFQAITVEKQSTKRYHNSIGVIMKLSKCGRLLLDYAVEQMDKNNFVSNNQLLKKGFNELLEHTGQTAYSTGTINKAFSELCQHNLLYNEDTSKGTYQVNPVFFFNGSEKAREELIRSRLEEPHKHLIKKYRREQLENKNEE